MSQKVAEAGQKLKMQQSQAKKKLTRVKKII